MIAATKGRKDIVLKLIQRGANLNLVDKVSMQSYISTVWY